jgi:molybdate transport system ATP-binding protein
VITIDVNHRQGAFVLRAQLAAAGPTLAVCGPSGAGKTTLLNIVAGLVRPTEGRVSINDAVLLDTRAGVDLPPHRRAIGYVFQELRLFPHLKVQRNLLYGRRFAAKPAVVDFEQVVDLLGLGDLLSRWPGRLSGGEKQRVAIGRALLANPRLLLLDEPLAALDEARRGEILAYIEKLRDAFAVPIIFVSHRPSEVERLASDIAMIEQGRLVQMKTGLVGRPASPAKTFPAPSP